MFSRCAAQRADVWNIVRILSIHLSSNSCHVNHAQSSSHFSRSHRCMPSRHQWHGACWPWRGASALYCQTWDGCHIWYIMILIHTSLRTYVSFKKHSKKTYYTRQNWKLLDMVVRHHVCTMWLLCWRFCDENDSSRLPSPQVCTFACDGLGWRSGTSRSTFRATIQLRLGDISRFTFFCQTHKPF